MGLRPQGGKFRRQIERIRVDTAKRLGRKWSIFRQIWHKEKNVQASLQWHSRLARRTYKSVLTKKCEGREFEPPLEQGFQRGFEIIKRSRKGPGTGIRTLA